MHYLIVDGNSVGYASQYSTPLSHNGQPVQAVFGFMKTMQKIVRENPTAKVLVLWDEKAHFRYELYPEYKGSRGKKPDQLKAREEYKSQIPIIMEFLTLLGIDQVSAEGFEADDLAGFFARRLAKQIKKAKLISGDEDWIQLVNSLIIWQDPRNGGDKVCNRDNFSEMTGVSSVKQFLELKAMEGDSSDEIKGVNGIGAKTGKAILEEFGSVLAMIKTHRVFGDFDKETIPPSLSRTKKKINDFCGSKEAIKGYLRNIKLMDLMTDERDSQMAKNIVVTKGALDFDAFAGRCMDMNFASITTRFTTWQNTFGGN